MGFRFAYAILLRFSIILFKIIQEIEYKNQKILWDIDMKEKATQQSKDTAK
jgi:hypothetical protein